jgi:hypothetical protein
MATSRASVLVVFRNKGADDDPSCVTSVCHFCVSLCSLPFYVSLPFVCAFVRSLMRRVAMKVGYVKADGCRLIDMIEVIGKESFGVSVSGERIWRLMLT